MANTHHTVPIMVPGDPSNSNAVPLDDAERYAEHVPAGTDGTHITARVNFFDVTLPKVDKLHIYSITITNTGSDGEVKVAGLRKDVIKQLVTIAPLSSQQGKFATDYHSTMVFLSPQNPTSATVTLPGATNSPAQTFHVNLSQVNVLIKSDLNGALSGRDNKDCLPWMNALNILSRSIAAQKNVKVGRDKFFPAGVGDSIWANSLNFRSGFFTSMRPVRNGVVMNIRGVACAFIVEQAVHSYAQSYNGGFRPDLAVTALRNLDHYFKSLVKGLRVRFLYAPPSALNPAKSGILSSPVQGSKIRRVNGFGDSAALQTFTHSIHGVITVQNYFNQHVLAGGSRLKHPNLLTCNLGTRDKPCYVPAELLYIAPNQPFLGKLPENAMRDMIRVSQRLPYKNVTLIEDCLGPAGMFSSQSIQKSLHNGITINTRMKQTDARMISVPTLSYRNQDITDRDSRGVTGELRKGKWNLRDIQFKKSGNMRALGVIQIKRAWASEVAFRSLATALTKYGLSGFHDISVATSASTAPEDLTAAAICLAGKCAEISNKKMPEKDRPRRFLLVVLPDQSAEAYDRVKWWADVYTGAHTVCVTAGNAAQLTKAPFQGNLALKFNAKAGGHNHTLLGTELDYMHGDGTTMFVGADVTHPGPGSVAHCPSIAAVVASDDRSAVNYPGSLRLQRCKQESIQDLDSMMIDRLEAWYAKNGSAPENILFYRDGVSESQFAMVKNQELPKIRNACLGFVKKHPGLGNYTPRITLVVCGKRHHTRFYPQAQVPSKVKWAVDRNDNFRPGLVVDDPSIRNAFHFDFYLQSHAALKGTARPCHYFVIHNAMRLSADRLQRITNNLCWTFARALTPISYASPAYYADRLAERGRCYLAPFISASSSARPQESTLLEGLANAANATMEDKDMHVLAKIKGGYCARKGFPAWGHVGRNPFSVAVADTMFYI